MMGGSCFRFVDHIELRKNGTCTLNCYPQRPRVWIYGDKPATAAQLAIATSGQVARWPDSCLHYSAPIILPFLRPAIVFPALFCHS